MLCRTASSRVSFLVIIAAAIGFAFSPAATIAQETERVPPGDLSDFFSPPGIKTEGLNSTTRTIDSKTKAKPTKTDPAPNSTTMPKVESPAPEAASTTTTKKTPDPPAASTKSAKTESKDSASHGRVQIESKEIDAIDGGISFGPPTITNWRVAMVLASGNKQLPNVFCRIPVPVQWPEQKVSVYEENIPPEISDVGWEDLGNIRMMTFRLKGVPAGSQVVATVTFTVETSQILAPKNTSIFRVPDKRSRETKLYLGESPEIGLRNTKLKKQAKLLFDNSQSDWKKVEAIFDWVRESIEERAGKSKGSIETFKDKFGTGEDRVSLFVAMCRLNKVPARMVFIDGSQYAEFYLVDDKKKGHWFPAQVSGIREFGSIGEPRVILQKGDRYKVPGKKKKLKFVPAAGTSKGVRPPILKFAREPLSVK